MRAGGGQVNNYFSSQVARRTGTCTGGVISGVRLTLSLTPLAALVSGFVKKLSIHTFFMALFCFYYTFPRHIFKWLQELHRPGAVSDYVRFFLMRKVAVQDTTDGLKIWHLEAASKVYYIAAGEQ